MVYEAPDRDLGLIRRTVEFTFDVSDAMQNTLYDQQFTIDLLPVDNEEPVVTNNGLQANALIYHLSQPTKCHLAVGVVFSGYTYFLLEVQVFKINGKYIGGNIFGDSIQFRQFGGHLKIKVSVDNFFLNT